MLSVAEYASRYATCNGHGVCLYFICFIRGIGDGWRYLDLGTFVPMGFSPSPA